MLQLLLFFTKKYVQASEATLQTTNYDLTCESQEPSPDLLVGRSLLGQVEASEFPLTLTKISALKERKRSTEVVARIRIFSLSASA